VKRKSLKHPKYQQTGAGGDSRIKKKEWGKSPSDRDVRREGGWFSTRPRKGEGGEGAEKRKVDDLGGEAQHE